MGKNVMSLAVIVALAVALALDAPHVHWTGVRMVGGGMAAVGVLLLILARLQLGASFSVRAKARKLVTTGLYSRIRNPIYVFSAMFLLGLVIVTEWWLMLLPLALLIPVQVARARNEERVLTEAFGEEYERYRAETWF